MLLQGNIAETSLKRESASGSPQISILQSQKLVNYKLVVFQTDVSNYFTAVRDRMHWDQSETPTYYARVKLLLYCQLLIQRPSNYLMRSLQDRIGGRQGELT